MVGQSACPHLHHYFMCAKASSKSSGQTYIRFNSPDGKHKHVGSVPKAVELEAIDKGQDTQKALAAYKDALQEVQRKEKEEREKITGMGPEREQAVEKFRSKYGKLEATALVKMKGWTHKASFLEVSEQTHVIYISPEGRSFGTIKQVEAMLGFRLMAGEDLGSLVQDARQAATDEWGDMSDKVNPLRRTSDGTTLKEAVDSGEFTAHELKNTHVHKVSGKEAETQKRRVQEEDYEPAEYLLGEVPKPLLDDEGKLSTEFSKAKLLNAAPLAADCCKMYKDMKRRKFKKLHLVVVSSRKPIDHPLSKALSGVYYADSKRIDAFGGKTFYTKVAFSKSRLIVCGLYLFWSKTKQAWQVSKELDDNNAGFLVHKGDLKLGPRASPKARTLTRQCIDRLREARKRKRPHPDRE